MREVVTNIDGYKNESSMSCTSGGNLGRRLDVMFSAAVICGIVIARWNFAPKLGMAPLFASERKILS
jgi:hypothetical protein